MLRLGFVLAGSIKAKSSKGDAKEKKHIQLHGRQFTYSGSCWYFFL